MTKNDTCKRLLTAAAVLLAAAAMLHTLFVGLEIDEEYALSLGFRLVRGDRLFYSMWEPHQLSALPPALLIAAYTAVTGTTTGVLLFVRVTMLVLKAVLSVWFYRSLRAPLGRTNACLLALVLFVFTPKWFLGPDYVSQQFHFTLAAFLFFYGYYAPGPQQYRGLWRVAAGAVCACFSFLAYPQSAAAAPFLLLGLWLLDRAAPRRCGALLFLVSCAVCGGAFALWLLQGMGFDLPALLARAALILNDPQYDFTAGERLHTLAGQAAAVLQTCRVPALAAAVAVLAGVLSGRGSRPAPARLLERLLWYFTFFLTLWCTAHSLISVSLDFRHLYLAAALAGGWTFCCDRREVQHRTLRRLLFWLGWLPGMAAYLFILRSTLIALCTTFMYLFWPALCGAAALALKSPAAPHRRRQTQLLLLCMLLAAALPRLWLVQQTGWRCGTVREVAVQRITTGPAAGTWADEKAADMQECLYEALAPYAGQPVLQAIGEQHGLGFLMADGTLTIAQASVISGTDSDPRFEQYYTELPEKRPRVILYDDAEVRDMAAFHTWLEQHFTITDRYTVQHGTASLQVLIVG